MANSQIISKALGALLDIMTSAEVPEPQCVEAAAAIIEFEAPVAVFDLTYEYLLGVAEDDEQKPALKLKALKLLRKVEAKRIAPGTARAIDTAASITLGQRLANSKRRLQLVRKGTLPPMPGWAEGIEDAEPVFVETVGIAEKLKAAREGAVANKELVLPDPAAMGE